MQRMQRGRSKRIEKFEDEVARVRWILCVTARDQPVYIGWDFHFTRLEPQHSRQSQAGPEPTKLEPDVLTRSAAQVVIGFGNRREPTQNSKHDILNVRSSLFCPRKSA